jgi:ribonuclease PH
MTSLASACEEIRCDGRLADTLRQPAVVPNIFPFAAGSVLFSLGNTRVLCAVTLNAGVPSFLRGKKTGWLTAEYAMLPAATTVRTPREVISHKRSGRSIEISRLIGRSLRAILNLTGMGEYTITVDCDVLQADGGTRTAAICGSFLALRAAEKRWLTDGIISSPIIIDEIAALSVGWNGSSALVDMNFSEDTATIADFNIVLARSGGIVEIQGSAEKKPVCWAEYQKIMNSAQSAITTIFAFYDTLV